MLRWIRKMWPDKIRYQLILGISLVQLIVMSILVSDIISRQKTFLRSYSKSQAVSLANVFAINSGPLIRNHDTAGLRRLAASYNNFAHLQYVMILSTDGTVLAHSNNRETGYRPKDIIGKKLNISASHVQTLQDEYDTLDVAAPIKEESKIIGWARVGVEQSFIFKDLDKIYRNGVLYIIVALLLGSLVAIVIAFKLSKELQRLIGIANAIRSGQRDKYSTFFKTYEVSVLSDAIQKMLDEIISKEKMASKIMETMPVGVWITDKEGTILSGNTEAKNIWKGAKFVGIEDYGVYKAWFVNTGKLVETHEWSTAITISEKKAVLNQEIEIECFDRSRKIILNSSMPLLDDHGELEGAVIINIDVTDRRRTEKDLIYYKYALDQSSIVAITDEHGIIQYVNEYFCKISQYAYHELIGRDHRIINSGYHPKAFFHELWSTIGKGHIWRGEVKNKAKDGSCFWVDTTIVPFMNERHKPYQYVVLRTDITDKKLAEERLIKMNHDINERVKELRCLYRLSELANNPAIAMDVLLQESVRMIPNSYQHSKEACTRIYFSGKVFESDNFFESHWKQESYIKIKEAVIGKVEVYYVQEMPLEDEGPYLAEERMLINTVAEILGSAAEKKKNEQEVLRLNRLYQFISEINERMLKVDTVEEVYNEACRIAYEYGKCCMAWIGVYDTSKDKVIPVAWAGYNDDYLTNINISPSNPVTNRGPVGRVFNTENYYCCNDIENDPDMLFWRNEALKHNYRSVISLPIKVDDELVSVYTLYMSEPFFFNATEVRLLEEVTENIAYVLDKIRIRGLQKQAEIELQRSEEKFRSLIEQSLVGVYILQENTFVYVNPGFEKLTGYTRDELLSDVKFESLVHPDDRPMVLSNYTNRLEGNAPVDQYSFKGIRKDGSIVIVEVYVSRIIYNNQQSAIGTVVDITDKIEEEIRLGQAVIDAQEKERVQIGMELHDNVQQLMSASLINLGFVRKYFHADNKKALDNLENVRKHLFEAHAELRRLSHQLAPSMDEHETSLRDKIEYLINTLDKTKQLEVVIDIDDQGQEISTVAQLSIYRMLQEQMNNITKYAAANRVIIRVTIHERRWIRLIIKDDGQGFDTTTKREGIGLENIKRRAQLLGGEARVISSPGNGCEINALIHNG